MIFRTIEFISDDSKSFSGRDLGEWYRQVYEIDTLDLSDDSVTIRFPEDTFAVTSSFIGGMFKNSVRFFGWKGFKEHYIFDYRHEEMLIDGLRWYDPPLFLRVRETSSLSYY